MVDMKGPEDWLICPIFYREPLSQVRDMSSMFQHSEHDAHGCCCVNWMVKVLPPFSLIHLCETRDGDQPYGLTCNVHLDSMGRSGLDTADAANTPESSFISQRIEVRG